MSLELSDLPYSIDALTAHGMSKETMEYHHNIHHKAYVDNGNNLLKDTAWQNKSLEEIIVGTYDSSGIAQNGIFNNVSQHWNHEQFWQMMSPSQIKMPSELEKAITDFYLDNNADNRELYINSWTFFSIQKILELNKDKILNLEINDQSITKGFNTQGDFNSL